MCNVEAVGRDRSTIATSLFVFCLRRIARRRTPIVPCVVRPRLRAARRAAVSSVSTKQPGCVCATCKASSSPRCKPKSRLNTSSSVDKAAVRVTLRKCTVLWVSAFGRYFATSSQTAKGTSTWGKSASNSVHPTSSKWMSGPASHTTIGGGGSFPATQPPVHVVSDK